MAPRRTSLLPPTSGCSGEGSGVRGRANLLATLLLLALLLPACRDSDSPSNANPLTPELQQVLQQVAEIRDLPAPTNLKAGTVPGSDVSERLDDLLTDSDRKAFAHLTTLYRLLGHLGPNEDYHGAYREFVGDAVIGFYSIPDKEFFIVGESDNFDSLSAQQRSTVAHEFTHALQDSNFDLQTTFERTLDDLDWSLALTSVVEGDAVGTEGSWARKFARLPVPGRAILASIAQNGSVSASIEREFRFPYTTGAEWVGIVRSQRGNEAINSILKGRRITTAEIIHPDLYHSNFTPDQVALPDLTAALGSGWRHESGGAFGEFQLRNYLQLKLPALPAVTAAAGWRGDRYDVYVHGDDSVAAFHIRFASNTEAEEFVAAQDSLLSASTAKAASLLSTIFWLPDGRTTIRATTTGPDVIFVIGSNNSVAEAAFKALSEK